MLTESSKGNHHQVSLSPTPDVNHLRNGELHCTSDNSRHDTRRRHERVQCERARHIRREVPVRLLLERIDEKYKEYLDGMKLTP